MVSGLLELLELLLGDGQMTRPSSTESHEPSASSSYSLELRGGEVALPRRDSSELLGNMQDEF